MRLWDAALDYGVSCTRGLQLLSRVLSHHGKGNHSCPLYDTGPLEDSVMGHLLSNPLWRAGASTGDRVGAVNMPICELGLAKFRGNVYSFPIT